MAPTRPSTENTPVPRHLGWCLECKVGLYSEYDANLQASYQCTQCPESSSTQETGASSIDACLCVENKYNSIRLGTIYGHPDNFNDSASRFLMAASMDEILLGAQCVTGPVSEKFIDCAPRNASERLGEMPLVQTGYAEFGTSIGSVRSGANSTNGSRIFFSCPFHQKACRSIRIHDNSSNCE